MPVGIPYSISTFTKKEVEKIFNQIGTRKKTEWFDIVFAPKSKELARILVITSKKIGNSPKRNKLRRRLKSIFFEEKMFNSNFDYILIAKHGAACLSFLELKNILLSLQH